VGPEDSVTIQNPILGRIPVVRRWTGPGEQPQSGSGYTVKAAGRDYGPSERFYRRSLESRFFDAEHRDRSVRKLLSPYYMDQWQAWYTGQTFTLPFFEISRGGCNDASADTAAELEGGS